MGWTQSALPLWAAMISFRRQIGLSSALQGVFGAGWAAAGTMARTRAATPRPNLRNFIKITPQTHVFFVETMSQSARQYNRRMTRQKGCSIAWQLLFRESPDEGSNPDSERKPAGRVRSPGPDRDNAGHRPGPRMFYARQDRSPTEGGRGRLQRGAGTGRPVQEGPRRNL